MAYYEYNKHHNYWYIENLKGTQEWEFFASILNFVLSMIVMHK
jgi:hypothetical protein